MSKTKKVQRSNALKTADPAETRPHAECREQHRRRGGAECGAPKRICGDSIPPRGCSRGWELGIQLPLYLTFADLSFNVILHLTEVELLMLILHANAAGLQSQLFLSMEGEPF